MKFAIGQVVPTIGSGIYNYAAALPEGNFLVSNGDEHLTDDDFGNQSNKPKSKSRKTKCK